MPGIARRHNDVMEHENVVRRLAAGERLDDATAERFFGLIMTGDVSPILLASALTAMRLRGETEDELRGAVRAVRACMARIETPDDGPMLDPIDVCGTGGDGLGTLNISTAVAFVLAGLGVPVAKHGNRALSSRSGATDVLGMLGIAPDGDLRKQAARLRREGLVFLSAPVHHPAMRHAAEVRRTLGFRTLFNLIGPLCNPASVRRQMIGVFDKRWLDPVARTLGLLGGSNVLAIHGETDRGGSDELTLAGTGHIASWQGGILRHAVIEPEMAGFARRSIAAIEGGLPAENAEALVALLDGRPGPYRDTVLLNAAVALHVAGVGPVLDDRGVIPDLLRANVARAMSAIETGAARAALSRAAGQDVTAASLSFFEMPGPR